MPQVDLVDETFVVADAGEVAAVVRDARRWRRWWPDLELSVFEDRGRKGVRWSVTGALVGSMEVWLEPHGDGVIVHYYLRADATEPGRPTRARRLSDRAALRESRRRQMAARRIFWAVKDGLENGRRPGEPGRRPTDGAAGGAAAGVTSGAAAGVRSGAASGAASGATAGDIPGATPESAPGAAPEAASGAAS